MSGEKRITIEDIGGDFGFRVKWSVLDHWADFEVYAVIEVGDFKRFMRSEWKDSGDTTPNISDAKKYLSGFIKWDGCSEFKFDSHLCGAEAFKKHCALLRYIYLRAPELMGRGHDGLDGQWGDEVMPSMEISK